MSNYRTCPYYLTFYKGGFNPEEFVLSCILIYIYLAKPKSGAPGFITIIIMMMMIVLFTLVHNTI